MIEIKVTPERIRNLMSKQGNIRQATTQEAEAFLVVYGEQIKDDLEYALKWFVSQKMGKV